MDNQEELREQCEAFRRKLLQQKLLAVDADFVRRFNDFVAEYPRVVEWNGSALLKALVFCLECAIKDRHPFARWKPLVIQTPQVLAARCIDGFTPLHLVCRYDPNACDIISFFLETFPDGAKMKTESQVTPLHTACSCNAPLPVIRLLVEANPQAAYVRDKHGDAPLHYACWGRIGFSQDAIRYLVLRAPGICFHRNEVDKMPMDVGNCTWPRNYEAAEFLTKVTKAMAGVLLKQFYSHRLPDEIFDHLVAFLPVWTMIEKTLSHGEIAVLLRRDHVREEFDAHFQTE